MVRLTLTARGSTLPSLPTTIGDQWLVEDGLAAGDKVIVEGLQKIQPGAPVQATEAGTEATADAAEPAAPVDADASKQ